MNRLAGAFSEAEGDDTPPTPPPEEMIPDVEQGGEPSPQGIERDTRQEAETPEPQEDARLAEEPEENDGNQTQAEPHHRRTARERREARKLEMHRLREENAALRREVEGIKARQHSQDGNWLQTQLQIVDSRLAECLNDEQQADSLWLAARNANNPVDELKAQRIRDEARDRAGSLRADRERLTNELARQRNAPPQQLPVPGDPIIDSFAARFRADNPWMQYSPFPG